MTIPNMEQILRAPVILLAEAKEGTQFPEWVQLLKTGTFTDPRYGKFVITEKMLSEMVTNFKAKVRGIDPAIDFKHESEAEAAAWMLDLEVRPGQKDIGLWAKPDWTGAGQKALSEKTYRYLSADFNQNYKDNEAGKSHGCVLLGAALTNRPVIKGMQPVIQLSEGDSMPEITPEQQVKLAALMKQLGCSSVDELISKVSGMKPKEEVEQKEVELKEKEMALSEKSTKLSELESEVAKLKGEKVLSEKEKTFEKMVTEGKAIPAQKESFLAGDLMKFAELAPKGGVKITEKGTEEGGAGDVNADEEDKVLKLAEAKVKSGEAKDLGKAISIVLKEQKEATK